MGLLLPLAFAPFNIYTFAFLTPAVLLYQWQKSTPGQAFWKGALFGLGFFSAGVSWVYISIHTYGHASTFVSILITSAMIAFLALFPATQGYALMRIFGKKNNTLLCLAAFPATWVIWEWLRTMPFNGFPWLFLGYSQLATPLKGLAPYFGIYGVSLATAVMCGSLVLMASRRLLSTKLIALALLGLLLISGWLLGLVRWTKPEGPPISVTLVQANISQSIKWEPEEFADILKNYQTLTQPHWNHSLLIWPEAALPAFSFQIQGPLRGLNDLAQKNQSALLLGVLLADSAAQQYYNGILVLGTGSGEYRKRHLVAFGEYTPLTSIFSFLIRYWNIPMSNFSPGPDKQPPLKMDGIQIAPFICYEIAFPNYVLKYAKESTLIVNISDDSWFGKSVASMQQMEMARFRALEMGRYALLVANTGVTAIVAPTGDIISRLPLHERGALTGTVTGMQGKTPLMRWDYYPVWILVLVLLLISFRPIYRFFCFR